MDLVGSIIFFLPIILNISYFLIHIQSNEVENLGLQVNDSWEDRMSSSKPSCRVLLIDMAQNAATSPFQGNDGGGAPPDPPQNPDDYAYDDYHPEYDVVHNEKILDFSGNLLSILLPCYNTLDLQ